MTRYILVSLTVVSLLATSGSKASANDIVDFLRAMQSLNRHDSHRDDHGSSRRIAVGSADVYRGHGGYSSRDIYKQHQRFAERHDRYGFYDSDRYRDPGQPYGVQRPNATIHYRVGSSRSSGYAPLPYTPVPRQPIYPVPQTPVYGYPPAPAPNQIQPLPHQLGQIVDCSVPLATCVRVKDPENIAPHAIPVTVAVRDPNLCDHACDCCTERVVYVQIFVPPCPMQKLRISPCRTYMKLDYGDYEVEITSRNGLITVDYDD